MRFRRTAAHAAWRRMKVAGRASPSSASASIQCGFEGMLYIVIDNRVKRFEQIQKNPRAELSGWVGGK